MVKDFTYKGVFITLKGTSYIYIHTLIFFTVINITCMIIGEC